VRFENIPLLRSIAEKIFAVSKNFTYIKVAHICWLEDVIDGICLSHSKIKWRPFLQDVVIKDTPKNSFTVEPWLAKALIKEKNQLTTKFLIIFTLLSKKNFINKNLMHHQSSPNCAENVINELCTGQHNMKINLPKLWFISPKIWWLSLKYSFLFQVCFLQSFLL
jgi:hypothetical protein